MSIYYGGMAVKGFGHYLPTQKGLARIRHKLYTNSNTSCQFHVLLTFSQFRAARDCDLNLSAEKKNFEA